MFPGCIKFLIFLRTGTRLLFSVVTNGRKPQRKRQTKIRNKIFLGRVSSYWLELRIFQLPADSISYTAWIPYRMPRYKPIRFRGLTLRAVLHFRLPLPQLYLLYRRHLGFYRVAPRSGLCNVQLGKFMKLVGEYTNFMYFKTLSYLYSTRFTVRVIFYTVSMVENLGYARTGDVLTCLVLPINIQCCSLCTPQSPRRNTSSKLLRKYRITRPFGWLLEY